MYACKWLGNMYVVHLRNIRLCRLLSHLQAISISICLNFRASVLRIHTVMNLHASNYGDIRERCGTMNLLWRCIVCVVIGSTSLWQHVHTVGKMVIYDIYWLSVSTEKDRILHQAFF